MYRGPLIGVCISLLAVAAFANDPLPYLTGPGSARGGGAGHNNTDDVLVDNLCTSVSEISKALYGAAASYNSWVAFDYTPDKAVKINKLWFHYVYNTTTTKSTLNFRLYRGANPGTGSIVRSWDVPTSNYNEVNTGWIYGTRAVYRAEVTIPDQDLTAKIKYWFAYRSATTSTSNALYWCVRKDSVKEEEVWWYLYGAWKTAQGHDPTLGRVEQSYKIEGVLSGIAPTSFGKVKTLFH